MADFKQAAKWMDQGKKVRRSDSSIDKDSFFHARRQGFIHYYSSILQRELEDALEIRDVLATDWEIAE